MKPLNRTDVSPLSLPLISPPSCDASLQIGENGPGLIFWYPQRDETDGDVRVHRPSRLCGETDCMEGVFTGG